MDEIKAVVTKKHPFECRHESKLIALFRIFRTIRILMQVPKRTIFHRNGLPLLKSFRLRPWWEKSSKYLWRNEVIENWAFSKLMAIFSHYRSIRILTQGRKPAIFPNKTITSGMILIYTWMNDLNRVSGEKWLATSRNFDTISAFWRFFNVRIPERYVPADLFRNNLG